MSYGPALVQVLTIIRTVSASDGRVMADKVLFVDDNLSILEGYKRNLCRKFQVTIALSGVEGLTALDESGPFEVVVSDMQMPGMTGLQFFEQVMRRAPNTVCILLTGQADLNTMIAAASQSVFKILAKPCAIERLAEAITRGVAEYTRRASRGKQPSEIANSTMSH